MVAKFVSTAIHFPVCYLLVVKFNTSVVGLAYAHGVNTGICFITVLIYSFCSTRIRTVLQPWDRETFRGWGAYLKISLPVTLMICSEWWAFEVLTLWSGILGVLDLAAQTIFIQVCATLFMVALGIQEATCGIMGNCIGANNVPLAKRFFTLIATFSMAIIISLSVTVLCLRIPIIEIFTHDEDLIEMT